jgi:branched-chain amino acid transport system permease protein
MSWNISRGVLATCIIVVLLLICIPLTESRYLIDLSTEILVYALFALSLNVIIGFSGNVSFGHAAYFAIGGYANAILLTTYGWPLIFAFPAAVVLSGVAAAFVAYCCTRLTDIYFAMLTLAFSMLVWAIAFKWRSVTGGDDGYVGVTVPAFIDTRVPFFYFTLIVVTTSCIILWLICHSAFGQSLIAVRENLTRAGFIGVNTRLMRGIAFVIAGTFAGVAGANFCHV